VPGDVLAVGFEPGHPKEPLQLLSLWGLFTRTVRKPSNRTTRWTFPNGLVGVRVSFQASSTSNLVIKTVEESLIFLYLDDLASFTIQRRVLAE